MPSWWPFPRKTPSGASAPPATAELQDPLPEPKWFWRRLLVFLTAIAVTALVWRIVEHAAVLGAKSPAEAIRGLVTIAKYLLILLLVDRVLYLIAPSADQAGHMIGKLWAIRAGATLTSHAAAEGPEGSAEASSSITPAPAPSPATGAKPAPSLASE